MRETITAPNANVLIVDDNRINLKVTEGVLKPFQMKMDFATSGREAIEMVKMKNYDIIFMDHMMPEMDGVETTKRIRELESDVARTVPVIALTGNKEEAIREQLLKDGMNDFLTKPIDLQEICDIIKKWLPKNLLMGDLEAEKDEPMKDDIPIIEGLDVEQGIALSGGLEMYLEILEDFYLMIPQKAEKIEQYLSEHMLHDYTIEVHALKSTSRLIGATELSDRCYHLEQLGRAGKEELLRKDTPPMLALYRSYINILHPYGKKDEGEKEDTSIEVLIALLEQLYSGVDCFDLDKVDEAMQGLERYQLPAICHDHMEMLRVYVADVAMQDIMDTAKQMITVLKQI